MRPLPSEQTQQAEYERAYAIGYAHGETAALKLVVTALLSNLQTLAQHR